MTPTPSSAVVRPTLPAEPMSPVSRDDIPEGEEWGYQLKWDGVRTLAIVQDGRVELYGKKLTRKDSTYPEIVRRLQQLKGTYLLDGETVYFDAALGRPVFQKVLQRERTRTAASLARSSAVQPVSFVLFDLLHINGDEIRRLPYRERYARLREAFPNDGDPSLFVTDLFPNGHSLWQWVETHGWEGIVSKRLTAPYREGKQHRDAYKKRTIQRYDVTVVGVTIRENRAASLVMSYNDVYFGRVSLGLNERSRASLLAYADRHSSDISAFRAVPNDLKQEKVVYLTQPIPLSVTGLEITADGLLRHPKLADPPELERTLAKALH